MREIVHIQAGQCGNQIGAKVSIFFFCFIQLFRGNVKYALSHLVDQRISTGKWINRGNSFFN